MVRKTMSSIMSRCFWSEKWPGELVVSDWKIIAGHSASAMRVRSSLLTFGKSDLESIKEILKGYSALVITA